MEFSAEAKKQVDKLLSRYPTKEAALLPVLHVAQKEFGYVSPDVEKFVAGVLELPPIKVHAVATFYTMYNKKPVGKYHVQVCTNIGCSLLGADHLVKYIEKKLGIRKGETTADGRFTLIEVECLGSCGTAPVMQVNDDYYENLTEQKIDAILDGMK
jgi:NADH-quinone oxidoreductase subunit E